MTLYFSAVDSAGHTFGPKSRETRAAIAEIDEQIGRLWRSIESLNANDDAQISLLLLSDHGMAEVAPDILTERHYVDHPAVDQIIVETAPPRVFRRGGVARADPRGMHRYPNDLEDMAAFLVAVGHGFHSGVMIPEAHKLDVYSVAARLLALKTPVDLASDGGYLIRALRKQ